MTGDIATRYEESRQVVGNKQKALLDDRAHNKMLSYLGKTDRAKFLDLWKEVKGQKSKEARLVKQIDVIDYIIQICLYSKEFDKKRFEEFFLTAEKKLTDPDLIYLYDKIRRRMYGNNKLAAV